MIEPRPGGGDARAHRLASGRIARGAPSSKFITFAAAPLVLTPFVQPKTASEVPLAVRGPCLLHGHRPKVVPHPRPQAVLPISLPKNLPAKIA